MPAQKPRLLVTATVHLDSQWRWTLRDSIRDFLPRTLSENFALFRSHPSYILNFEGAFRYMLAEEYYPEAFAELRSWIAKGRWRPAGAMLDAPDVNIVSPESLLRHILYGNGYFERELGRRSRDVFLPDCFGFSHALPSIAVHCGLESFSSSKLIKWKAPGRIPFDIGRWRGPDGAEILAVLQPGGYGEGIDEDLTRSESWRARLEAMESVCGVPVGVRYYGTGDRGGSPDTETLDHVESASTAEGPIAVRSAGSDAILDELPEPARQRLPVHDSEILLPTHGTGCWTSQAALKRWNRKNEQLADAAERAAVIADWLGELPYPRERLNEGWLRFLWHQMHDDLTGTSIPEAYELTWNDQAVAANLLAGVLEDAVAGVARRLDTRAPESHPDARPVLIYNPIGQRRTEVVEVALPEHPQGRSLVVLRDGAPVPSQPEPLDGGGVRLLFAATVEPVSVTVFHLVDTDDSVTNQELAGQEGASDHVLNARVDRLENRRYRVSIDETGNLASLYDKRLDRELLGSPHRLELLRDRSNRWPAWEIRPETILEETPEPVEPAESVRVTEAGPVRVALEIRRTFRGSALVQTIRLAGGDAGDRVEVHNRLEWGTRGRLLKARFHLAAGNPLATYDLGWGAIERDNNSPDRYEVPAQQWAALADPAGELGVAILNDCHYGWDKPADDVLRLSLVRSPSSFRKYPHQRTQDLGSHRGVYALMGFDAGGGDQVEVCRQAERLNQPLLAFHVAPTTGDLGSQLSFLASTSDDVSLMALKKAEAGDTYVARIRELARRSTPVELVLPGAPVDGRRVRGDESALEEIAGGSLELTLGPWSVESLAFSLEARATPTPERGQREIELPFDRRAASLHDDAERVDFDGDGASLPGELLPRRLSLAGVELELAPANGPNAVRCRGQVIEIPEGYDRLWVVATSTGPGVRVPLQVAGARRSLAVGSWSGLLASRARPARWGGLRPGRSGHLARERLAWLGTHRHRVGAGGRDVDDEHYLFCYLYLDSIELPENAAAIELPDDERVHLFAMTVTRGDEAPPRSVAPLFGS